MLLTRRQSLVVYAAAALGGIGAALMLIEVCDMIARLIAG